MIIRPRGPRIWTPDQRKIWTPERKQTQLLAGITAGGVPGGGGGGGTDPDFASVVSLLHFDGANNSTTFTDVIGKTWTRTGSVAVISTAQSVYGGASGAMLGDNITTPDTADFKFGSGDLTIEFRMRSTGAYGGGNNYLLGKLNNLFAGEWGFWILSGTLYFLRNNDSPLFSSAFTWPNGVWTAIAVTRSGNDWKMFVDGSVVASTTNSTAITANTYTTKIGNPNQNLYFDEFRVTKGVARYTAAYTPAAAAFPDA